YRSIKELPRRIELFHLGLNIGNGPQGLSEKGFVLRGSMLLISANLKSPSRLEVLLQRIGLGLSRRRFLRCTRSLPATNRDEEKCCEDCDARKIRTAAGTHVRQE